MFTFDFLVLKVSVRLNLKGNRLKITSAKRQICEGKVGKGGNTLVSSVGMPVFLINNIKNGDSNICVEIAIKLLNKGTTLSTCR